MSGLWKLLLSTLYPSKCQLQSKDCQRSRNPQVNSLMFLSSFCRKIYHFCQVISDFQGGFFRDIAFLIILALSLKWFTSPILPLKMQCCICILRLNSYEILVEDSNSKWDCWHYGYDWDANWKIAWKRTKQFASFHTSTWT